MKKKFSDIIKAGAIGDAFGYNVEFKSWEEIKIIYSGQLLFSNCDNYVVSDDTQMTLFCLEALKENSENNNNNESVLNRVYEYYLDWNATQYKNIYFKKDFAKQINLHKRQAPGKTCLTALGSRRCGTMEKKINDSKGCGGIMRVAPIAFLNRHIDDIIYLGCMQAAITHGHPEGYLSSGFFAGLINLGIKGFDFDEAYKIVKEKILNYREVENFIKYLNKIEEYFDIEFNNPNEMTDFFGEGWTGETALGLSIYALRNGKDFKDTVVIATNHCGDSDSTASMAAQLYASFKNLEHNDLIVFNSLDISEIINKSLENIEVINNFSKINEIIETKNNNKLNNKFLKVIKIFFK